MSPLAQIGRAAAQEQRERQVAEQRLRAVVRLENVVERVAPRDKNRWGERPALRRGGQVSETRARQLRSTVNQLAAAVGHEEMPEDCGKSVQRLLAPEAVDAFLELAADGTFRPASKPALLGRSLSWSSLATLRDCLKILGEESGVKVVVPRVWRPTEADLAAVPSPEQLAALYERIVVMSRSAPVDASMARAVACMGVVLDTRMASGDLTSRRLEHLDLEGAQGPEMLAVWHRQNASHLPAVEKRVVLRPGTVAALRRWLVFRQKLVDGLQGSDHGKLWVTVKRMGRTVDGEPQTYEAGMPLQAWGLRYGFARGMERLDEVLSSRWEGPGSWEPLPTRIERLRRGAEWAQEQEAAR